MSALFLSLLPIYVFGNLHCIGMCGPLALMLGRHRYRYYYLFGRTFSFTLAGALAGGLGAVLHVFLQRYHISSLISFVFGGVIFVSGLLTLFKVRLPMRLGKWGFFDQLNRRLTTLILQDRPLPVFLFGFFTIALPCGQTVIVYSALALAGDAWIGLANGFLFAVLTTPSLFLAMHAQNIFPWARVHYNTVLGFCALVVGSLALCRGLAEAGMIPHLILNPHSSPEYHIALY